MMAALQLEKIALNLSAVSDFSVDFFRDADGNCAFPIAGTKFVAFYLVSGNYRYGISLPNDAKENDTINAVARGIRSLRNRIGAYRWDSIQA